MKKLLHELFYIPKYGKVTEKALIGRLTMYITVILCCMAGMAFTAYAFFSASVFSGNNSIQAAHFDIEITISETLVDPEEEAQDKEVTVIRDGASKYHADLIGGREYLVTIRATGTANTGFVLVTAGETQYFTQQLFRDTVNTLTFTLLPSDNMVVSFMPHFGTSSRYADFQNNVEDPFYVTEGKRVQLAVPLQSSPEHEEEDQKTQGETIQTPTQNTDPTGNPGSLKHYHVIQVGDTLYSISLLYQVDMTELRNLNNISDENVIKVGEQLLLPDNAVIPPEAAVPATTQPTTPKEPASNQ